MREIEIIIEADGSTSIDLKGFHGKGCSDITEQLSKSLGKVVQRDQKCEYFVPEQDIKIKQTNG